MYDLDPTSAEAAAIRAVILAAKPARKELQRLAKLCGIKANQKNTVIIDELKKVLTAPPSPVAPPPALPPARELPETPAEQATRGGRLEGSALVALAAGAPIGLLLCAALAACVWRRRLRAAAPTRWGASPQPSAVDLACKAAVRGAGGDDDSLPASEPRGG